MKLRWLASLLPQALLTRLARRFDTPGAWFDRAVEGSSFWMDASYSKWVRGDERRCRRYEAGGRW